MPAGNTEKAMEDQLIVSHDCFVLKAQLFLHACWILHWLVAKLWPTSSLNNIRSHKRGASRISFSVFILDGLPSAPAINIKWINFGRKKTNWGAQFLSSDIWWRKQLTNLIFCCTVKCVHYCWSCGPSENKRGSCYALTAKSIEEIAEK